MKLFSKKNLLIMGGGLIILLIILMRFTSEGFAIEKTCAPNQKNSSGTCVCGAGFVMAPFGGSFQNLKCVKNICKDSHGYMYDGKCKCFKGYSLTKNNTCVKNADPKNCNSIQGAVPDSNGNCICLDPNSVALKYGCAYIGNFCNIKHFNDYGSDSYNNGGYIQDGYIQIDGTCGKKNTTQL